MNYTGEVVDVSEVELSSGGTVATLSTVRMWSLVDTECTAHSFHNNTGRMVGQLFFSYT